MEKPTSDIGLLPELSHRRELAKTRREFGLTDRGLSMRDGATGAGHIPEGQDRHAVA